MDFIPQRRVVRRGMLERQRLPSVMAAYTIVRSSRRIG